MRGQVALGRLLPLLLALVLCASAQSTTVPSKTDAPKNDTTKAMDVTKFDGPKGTKCSITQKGGNITVYRDVTKYDVNKTKITSTMEITVSFLQLKELNANGTQVVDNTNKTHVMTSFSDQYFNCAMMKNVSIAYSTDVRADCFYCWTTFKGMFDKLGFNINVCILQNNGTITQQDEVSNVTAGQLKFTVDLTKGWPWCDGDCKNGPGEFMDMDIGIKLPPGAAKLLNKTVTTQDKQRPTRFDLGYGAMVEFSKIAAVDGTWKPLAQNTPTMVQKDGMSVVTLRFPRFATTLIYDPTVETGDKAFEGMAGSAVRTTLAVPVLIVAVFMALENLGAF